MRNKRCGEDVRQGRDRAGQANDLPEMSKNEQRTDHSAFHTEGKRRQMLVDGTPTVEDEEHVSMILLRPSRQTCSGPIGEPPASRHPVLETEPRVLTSETSLSVQFTGSKSRPAVTQAPSNPPASESLGDAGCFGGRRITSHFRNPDRSQVRYNTRMSFSDLSPANCFCFLSMSCLS